MGHQLSSCFNRCITFLFPFGYGEGYGYGDRDGNGKSDAAGRDETFSKEQRRRSIKWRKDFFLFIDVMKEHQERCMNMKLTTLINRLEARCKNGNLPSISVGDTVKVGVLIQEGEKTRVQPYQGVVIAQHRASLHTTITVRRVFQGIGVERIFTIHSPALKGIQILRRAKVRKAKLYYLRDRVGKAIRLKPRLSDQRNQGGQRSEKESFQ